jgi:hypothetical protein
VKISTALPTVDKVGAAPLAHLNPDHVAVRLPVESCLMYKTYDAPATVPVAVIGDTLPVRVSSRTWAEPADHAYAPPPVVVVTLEAATVDVKPVNPVVAIPPLLEMVSRVPL